MPVDPNKSSAIHPEFLWKYFLKGNFLFIVLQGFCEDLDRWCCGYLLHPVGNKLSLRSSEAKELLIRIGGQGHNERNEGSQKLRIGICRQQGKEIPWRKMEDEGQIILKRVSEVECSSVRYGRESAPNEINKSVKMASVFKAITFICSLVMLRPISKS